MARYLALMFVGVLSVMGVVGGNENITSSKTPTNLVLSDSVINNAETLAAEITKTERNTEHLKQLKDSLEKMTFILKCEELKYISYKQSLKQFKYENFQ